MEQLAWEEILCEVTEDADTGRRQAWPIGGGGATAVAAAATTTTTTTTAAATGIETGRRQRV